MRKETNKLLISPSRSNKWGSQWCALFPCCGGLGTGTSVPPLGSAAGGTGGTGVHKAWGLLAAPPSEASDLEGWEGDIHPVHGDGWLGKEGKPLKSLQVGALKSWMLGPCTDTSRVTRQFGDSCSKQFLSLELPCDEQSVIIGHMVLKAAELFGVSSHVVAVPSSSVLGLGQHLNEKLFYSSVLCAERCNRLIIFIL